MTVAAIVVAAGSGSRLGADVPKAFVRVAGRTLLSHVRERLLADLRFAETVVVAPAGWLDEAAEESGTRVVAGGATRRESVAAGLAALSDSIEHVLVHDAARPFVPAALIDRVLDALDAGADAVVPALPVTDTIKRIDEAGRVLGTVDRDNVVAVQTPQGFRRAALLTAHRSTASPATDDAALVEESHGLVVVVEGSREAFKITDRWDLAVAEWVAAGG